MTKPDRKALRCYVGCQEVQRVFVTLLEVIVEVVVEFGVEVEACYYQPGWWWVGGWVDAL